MKLGGKIQMSKIGKRLASITLAAAIGLALAAPAAHAERHPVDCGKVMEMVNAGKSAKEISAALKISNSSVYRCKKKAKPAAKAASSAPASTTGAAPSTPMTH